MWCGIEWYTQLGMWLYGFKIGTTVVIPNNTEQSHSQLQQSHTTYHYKAVLYINRKKSPQKWKEM